MNSRNIKISISIYYALVFMTLGGFSSYIGLYYSSKGFDHAEIGLLVSIGSVIALVAQPVWGILSDRSQYKNSILLICLVTSAVSIWLIPLAGNDIWLLSAFIAVFYFFQCAVNPLSDTIALELAGKDTFSFSFVRTVGSLGYAVMSAVAGWIFGYSIDYIFAVFSVFMLLSIIFAKFIPPVAGHQSRGNKVQVREIFRNRGLVLIYIYTFLIGSTQGFFFAFQAIYSEEQGIGTDLIGLGLLIGSISQFPFMLLFDKIYQRFGIVKIIWFSGLIHVIRWVLYAHYLSSATVLFIRVLHGGTYILFYLCLAEYVNKNVVKELKASAQMMNSIVLNGLSKIFGGIAGGYFASSYGFSPAFSVCAAICVLALIGLLIANRNRALLKVHRRQKSLNQKTVS